jgi:hypothetical protein
MLGIAAQLLWCITRFAELAVYQNIHFGIATDGLVAPYYPGPPSVRVDYGVSEFVRRTTTRTGCQLRASQAFEVW